VTGGGAVFQELATKVVEAMAGLAKKAGPKITVED
jgi:hypothetical protein